MLSPRLGADWGPFLIGSSRPTKIHTRLGADWDPFVIGSSGPPLYAAVIHFLGIFLCEGYWLGAIGCCLLCGTEIRVWGLPLRCSGSIFWGFSCVKEEMQCCSLLLLSLCMQPRQCDIVSSSFSHRLISVNLMGSLCMTCFQALTQGYEI